jgi:uncharacterized protein (DUF885 family)
VRLAGLLVLAVLAVRAAEVRRPEPRPYQAPVLAALLTSEDDLRGPIERYEADLGSLRRFYDTTGSARQNALRQFHSAWMSALERLPFEKLGVEARIDYLLFRNLLQRELAELDHLQRRLSELSELVPFAGTIENMLHNRQQLTPLDPAKAASGLVSIQSQITALSRNLPKASRTVASRGVRRVEQLRDSLKQWYGYYHGYDPLFTWWNAEPYRQLDKSLEEYGSRIRQELVGLRKDDRDTIVGDPIGREALLNELAAEMISYSPEQLITIANREFAWCEAEMKKASRELGYGEDWRKALEHVKNLYVPPGEQPKLILEQAVEAIEYVEKNRLVTVPPLARDTWRMTMMTPERQRVNPFFTGGETISVSYPTDTMTHEQKLMSMRGNNIHFSRSTVFHELIPGHHLQAYMSQRYRPYRGVFRTPFWGEGWALHWEFLFWDMGFPKTPENRIGMLFWRSHRAARIIFSLSFHLGKMTAQEAIDFLVERVGHERENAVAEVRRSFETSYAPLYQSAYMLGALQLRALHKDLVGSGKMTNQQFHDRILEGNSIPIEMVRASVTGQKLSKDFRPVWMFYGNVDPAPARAAAAKEAK